MPFKWGTAGDITKVKIIKDGVVLDEDVNKVVFNGVTIFNKHSTYVVTPYIKWNWTGKLYNDESDNELGYDEILQQVTSGDCYLEVGLDITKDGVAYTPTSSDNCIIAYNMSIGTIMKDESTPPTYDDSLTVHASGSDIKDGKSARITKSWTGSNTIIDAVYENKSNSVYWFLVFRCASAQWQFKGHNAYFAQRYQQYAKAPKASWSGFDWTPFPNGESRANFTATTFTA